MPAQHGHLRRLDYGRQQPAILQRQDDIQLRLRSAKLHQHNYSKTHQAIAELLRTAADRRWRRGLFGAKRGAGGKTAKRHSDERTNHYAENPVRANVERISGRRCGNRHLCDRQRVQPGGQRVWRVSGRHRGPVPGQHVRRASVRAKITANRLFTDSERRDLEASGFDAERDAEPKQHREPRLRAKRSSAGAAVQSAVARAVQHREQGNGANFRLREQNHLRRITVREYAGSDNGRGRHFLRFDLV